MSSEMKSRTLRFSAALMILACFPPQRSAETQTLASRTALSSRFFDDGAYVILRETQLSNSVPYGLHDFFKGPVNYLLDHDGVVYGYGYDFLAFL